MYRRSGANRFGLFRTKIALSLLVIAAMAVLLLLPAAHATGDRCHRTRISIWSEFIPFSTVREMLPLLEEYDIELHLAIDPEDIGSEELADLLRYAYGMDVEVRAWILLSYEDGYWPSETNAAEFYEQTVTFMDWVESEGLPVEWIEVDMEFTWQEMEELRELLASGDWLGLIRFFDRTIDKAAFEESVAIYRELVREIHARGFSVSCVTFPFVLDDLHDGKTALQDAIDMPVSPVDWDEVSFMVYRTTFEELLGQEYGSWLVYSYSRSARKAERDMGWKCALDLGITELETAPDGFYFPDELRGDVGAMKAGGIRKAHIYALDTISEDPHPERWVEGLARTRPRIPRWNPQVTLLRFALRSIDWFLGLIW